jgi:hypothetical protein
MFLASFLCIEPAKSHALRPKISWQIITTKQQFFLSKTSLNKLMRQLFSFFSSFFYIIHYWLIWLLIKTIQLLQKENTKKVLCFLWHLDPTFFVGPTCTFSSCLTFILLFYRQGRDRDIIFLSISGTLLLPTKCHFFSSFFMFFIHFKW